MHFRSILAASALLTLAACGGSGSDSEKPAGGDASPSPAAAAESGPSLASAPKSFAQCATCHGIKPGAVSVGPTLFGVFGRKAGADASYSYSDALKASGITWDEAALDKWLIAPMKDVPGTRMTFAGVDDAAKRKELIDYLKTLK